MARPSRLCPAAAPWLVPAASRKGGRATAAPPSPATALRFSIENAGKRAVVGEGRREVNTERDSRGREAPAADVTIARRCCISPLRYRGGGAEAGGRSVWRCPGGGGGVRMSVAVPVAVPVSLVSLVSLAAGAGLTFVRAPPAPPRAARPVLFHWAAAGGGRGPRDGRARCGTDVAPRPLRRRGESRKDKSPGPDPDPASMSSAEMGKFNISPDEDSSSYSSNSNDFSYPYPTKPAAMKR